MVTFWLGGNCPSPVSYGHGNQIHELKLSYSQLKLIPINSGGIKLVLIKVLLKPPYEGVVIRISLSVAKVHAICSFPRTSSSGHHRKLGVRKNSEIWEAAWNTILRHLLICVSCEIEGLNRHVSRLDSRHLNFHIPLARNGSTSRPIDNSNPATRSASSPQFPESRTSKQAKSRVPQNLLGPLTSACTFLLVALKFVGQGQFLESHQLRSHWMVAAWWLTLSCLTTQVQSHSEGAPAVLPSLHTARLGRDGALPVDPADRHRDHSTPVQP